MSAFHGHLRVDLSSTDTHADGIALRDGVMVYDDTVNGSGVGYAIAVGAELGDDCTAMAGGRLHEVEFSIYVNSSESSGLTSVDVTIGVYDAVATPIADFTITVDLTNGGLLPPLAPGEYATVSAVGLESLAITVPPSCTLTQRYANVVGDGTGVPSSIGQVLYDPPVLGSSEDRFFLNMPPNVGWFSFFGSPVANLFWSMKTSPTGTGDLNCDGTMDLFDIDPFVLALTSAGQDPPFANYNAAYPDCDGLRADVNDDGAVDLFDIDPFVQLLTGG